jgi:hypothetical protein
MVVEFRVTWAGSLFERGHGFGFAHSFGLRFFVQTEKHFVPRNLEPTFYNVPLKRGSKIYFIILCFATIVCLLKFVMGQFRMW